MGRNDNCWCGSKKKWKKCHFPELPADSAIDAKPAGREAIAVRYRKEWGIILKNEQQIEGCRQAGHLAALILDEVALLATPGTTTNELNRYAHERMISLGAKPAPLGYGKPPFPKSICTSLNEVICHGIPNEAPLHKGDIINIDISLFLNGFCGDCGKMVAVGGGASEERKRVFDSSLQALQESVAIIRPNASLAKIGDIIQNVSDSYRTSVVQDFVGHGIGAKMHEAPNVYHFRNELHIPLASGMIFTIEPMINAGAHQHIIDPHDKWTARTVDNRPSAQWEHTVLVTDVGYEILTPWTVTTCDLFSS
ncbi:MAG: methionyl aminopeptidase [Chlamydia sp.]